MGDLDWTGRHAFLCYASEDARQVDHLHAALEAAGVRVWRDTEDLWPGEDWREKIRAAITRDALVFVACFSTVSTTRAKSYQNEELALAVDELRLRRPDVPWLIPVRLDECDIPDRDLGGGRSLAALQRADLFGQRRTRELARLVAAVTRILGSRSERLSSALVPGRQGGGIPLRSAYLEQVRRIAPPDPPGLLGREAELAELAAFCTEEDRPTYAWWRADAWAGKSALLSTFVLRLPTKVAERVRIVSFFITARLAAQDTREAFTQVLLEQLAALTGQDLPPALPEATRDAYLLDLLGQAAVACQDAGLRLVLVIDGLDEDRGVTTGPDAHSIAGLLPADPPAGMRVIVAGRPNPPIPDDVVGWHPLRDPSIVRALEASPHARDIQRLGKQELQRLLRGSAGEQDLLGLLVAARGGLSMTDLESLSGLPGWEIEQILHTSAGRTFTCRPSRWSDKSGPDLYLLSHEELQVAATGYLGGQRIDGYRQRLHEWAVAYCAKGWPSETPEYLLSGYYRLLVSVGDLARMIACAGDLIRHDRMLDLTGGDTAALAEVRSALDLVAAQNHPDLSSALYLAFHRDRLIERNSNIPTGLPAIWATLGQTSRAEALANSITDPGRRTDALVQLALALAVIGRHGDAETLAHSIASPLRRADALAGLVEPLANSGRLDEAVAVARSITSIARKAHALAHVAELLTSSGNHDQASDIAQLAVITAKSVKDPNTRDRTLEQLSKRLTFLQIQQAIQAAQSITIPPARAEALMTAA